MKNVQVIIPFRLREGADLRRAANLEVVQAWWYAHGYEVAVVSDGLDGDAQFNRHRAYNRAVSGNPRAEVFIFTEADMLVHPHQIEYAVTLTKREPGLVVSFTQYRYLSDKTTQAVRDYFQDRTTQETAEWWALYPSHPVSVFAFETEYTMDDGRSIGAVNVVSRRTLELTGGFTEATSGNWYDDNIIEEGFAYLTGSKTRFVPGPAVHMYHLPGHKGDHLSEEDRIATATNKTILRTMRRNMQEQQPVRVKQLMQVRR